MGFGIWNVVSLAFWVCKREREREREMERQFGAVRPWKTRAWRRMMKKCKDQAHKGMHGRQEAKGEKEYVHPFLCHKHHFPTCSSL